MDVEKKLKQHQTYIDNINYLKEEIKYLSNDITLEGVSYDGIQTSETNKISSAVENEVLSREEKIHYLKHQLKQSQSYALDIENFFQKLDKIEWDIIKLKHEQGRNWKYIAEKVGYSKAYCQELRRKAVKSLYCEE